MTDDAGAQHWASKEITIYGKKTAGFEMIVFLCALIAILLKKKWTYGMKECRVLYMRFVQKYHTEYWIFAKGYYK